MKCSICKEGDHSASHCPELSDFFGERFFQPAGGMLSGEDSVSLNQKDRYDVGKHVNTHSSASIIESTHNGGSKTTRVPCSKVYTGDTCPCVL